MIKSDKSIFVHVREHLQGDINRGDFLTMSEDVKIRNAIQIARKFLEQYNSPVVFKSAILKDYICEIVMDVGLTHEKIIQVKINTVTGTIIEYIQ